MVTARQTKKPRQRPNAVWHFSSASIVADMSGCLQPGGPNSFNPVLHRMAAQRTRLPKSASVAGRHR